MSRAWTLEEAMKVPAVAKALGAELAASKKRKGTAKVQQAESNLVATLWQHMDLSGVDLGEWEKELRFHEERKWRFDFACPSRKLAVECEGLTSEGGRHQRRDGYSKDSEKYNAAVLGGWTLLRFTREQIMSLEAVRTIHEALETESKL